MDRQLGVRKICFPIFLLLSTIPFSGSSNAQVQERKFELQANSPGFWKLLDRNAKLDLFAGGFGFTEATGVTNVRGTVIRLFSPEGTLVVEVDDPAVSVLREQ